MSGRESEMCSHHTRNGPYRKWCLRKGTKTEGGKLFCHQHAPSAYKARRESMHRAVEQKMERLSRVGDIQRAETAVIEAAKEWRLEGDPGCVFATKARLVKAVDKLIELEGKR